MMRSFSLLAFLLAAALLAPSQSRAQRPTRADTTRAQPVQPEMRQEMQRMMPMMAEVMSQVTQSTMASLAEPETAQNLARFIRNYYTALVAQGFTEEQAMRIVSNVGMPALPGR